MFLSIKRGPSVAGAATLVQRSGDILRGFWRVPERPLVRDFSPVSDTGRRLE